MGEFKKKRFEPSQPFALVLRAQDFDQVLDFPADDERLQRYLRGETLDVSDLINREKRLAASYGSGTSTGIWKTRKQ